MKVKELVLPVLLLVQGGQLLAQNVILSADEFHIKGEEELDGEDASINQYDRFNKLTGADSTRYCCGRPCGGWVEDRYADGTLKHRGRYSRGLLVAYRNYHPDGSLEREFKRTGRRKSIRRTFYPDTRLRSCTRSVQGFVVEYMDHYPNGALRYNEERHKGDPYCLRMDLYAANGDPVSLVELVDRRNIEFNVKEFHPGGRLRSEGRSRFNSSDMGSRRIGVWRSYDSAGVLVKEEEYLDGRVTVVK